MSIANGKGRGKWQEVTDREPCPKCSKPKWCRIAADGQLLMCRHESAGAYRTKQDKNGAAYYLHRLNGDSAPADPPPGQAGNGEIPRADADTLHTIYTALLDMLHLSRPHRDNLRQRGLSDEEIDRRGYRSLGASGRIDRAAGLRKRFGDKVLAVPGFAIREKDGNRYLTLTGANGLLIPVRDTGGRILALKIRRDEATSAGKYCWLSSKKDGGPGPGSPAHLPLGIQGPVELVRLTEGALKADVATALSGMPTVGTAGATIWKPALEVLRQLQCKTVRLAWDADARSNPHVARGLLVCSRALAESGFTVEMESWPDEHKGIDDALAAGIPPQVLQGEHAREGICTVAAEADFNETAAEDEEGGKKSPATRLIDYAKAALEFWHTPDGTAYATTQAAPRKTWPLRSRSAREFLGYLYYQAEQTGASGEAIQTALNTLEGQAKFAGCERPAFIRLADDSGRIFLDLGSQDWQAVAVAPDGWKIVAEAPARFRRARGTLALPAPVAGGGLAELRRFVNVGSDDDWRLLIAWLLSALRPRGPYPILCLHGEQGSAKSTTARVVRSLIDPNSAPLRAEPREARDFIISATHSWVLALDNLSHVPAWLSDGLCRMSTGGGFATRELYTDGDETLFDAMRPCLLTGIEELATRSDLLDRCLILHLPAIPEEARQTEAEFFAAFEEARPRILGALLDAVAVGLREMPGVRLPRLPRLADFAKWVVACEPALGWEPGAFLRSYLANVEAGNELALDTSPLTAPLRAFLDANPTWTGTASELLDELTKLAGEQTARAKDWPKKPHVLSGKLRRLAPNLRKTGVDVTFDRDSSRKRGRLICLARKGADGASEASASVRSPHSTGNAGAASDTGRTQTGIPVDARNTAHSVISDSADTLDASSAPASDREVFEL